MFLGQLLLTLTYFSSIWNQVAFPIVKTNWYVLDTLKTTGQGKSLKIDKDHLVIFSYFRLVSEEC